MSYVVAVDSGGTFSDCVVVRDDGKMWTGKSPSTPPDYERGVCNAVELVAEQIGMTLTTLLEQTSMFSHGTTVATNALLTRTGCKTGLITTMGHEDALLIGRTHAKVAGLSAAETMDMSRLNKPEPIVDPTLIRGVAERVDCFGDIVVPLSDTSIAEAVASLVDAGVEAIAVSLLWSFRNDTHEQRIRRYIEAHAPHVTVSVSSEIAPRIGEYERVATVSINAFLSARTRGYLGDLERNLSELGFTGKASIMKSSGGISSVQQAVDEPVSLLTSGPAGGVVGALSLAGELGHENVLTTDVGGTSFDVGMIIRSEALLSQMPVFAQFHVTYPMIEISSIGAGGGSIAWVQPETGLLKVGPASAGASPGPACYGNGGQEATVTDANVVLGRIDPDYFLGGTRKLDAAASHKAVERVARLLNAGIDDTAEAIISIADAHMGDLVRKMTVEKGHDPRSFMVYAFGGAGPLHACGYSEGTGVRGVFVPAVSAVFSAYGIAQSDPASVLEQSLAIPLPAEAVTIETAFQTLESRALDELASYQSGGQDIQIYRELLVRYQGQKHELPVPVVGPVRSEEDVLRIIASFEGKYEARYGAGTVMKTAGLQAATCRVRAVKPLNLPTIRPADVHTVETDETRTRRIRFATTGWVDVPAYRLLSIQPGTTIEGPAVIDTALTTILVIPGFSASVDERFNVTMKEKQNSVVDTARKQGSLAAALTS